jgi:hypothetical protein
MPHRSPAEIDLLKSSQTGARRLPQGWSIPNQRVLSHCIIPNSIPN